jgi:CubicO group peptidase (beta-lactamase class C family)
VAVIGRPVPLAAIHERMARYGVPGVSIAVLDSGRIVWAKGYGVADAAAMLALVEAGRLDLDADINTALTSWQLPAPHGASPVAATR